MDNTPEKPFAIQLLIGVARLSDKSKEFIQLIDELLNRNVIDNHDIVMYLEHVIKERQYHWFEIQNVHCLILHMFTYLDNEILMNFFGKSNNYCTLRYIIMHLDKSKQVRKMCSKLMKKLLERFNITDIDAKLIVMYSNNPETILEVLKMQDFIPYLYIDDLIKLGKINDYPEIDKYIAEYIQTNEVNDMTAYDIIGLFECVIDVNTHVYQVISDITVQYLSNGKQMVDFIKKIGDYLFINNHDSFFTTVLDNCIYVMEKIGKNKDIFTDIESLAILFAIYTQFDDAKYIDRPYIGFQCVQNIKIMLKNILISIYPSLSEHAQTYVTFDIWKYFKKNKPEDMDTYMTCILTPKKSINSIEIIDADRLIQHLDEHFEKLPVGIKIKKVE